MRALLLTLGLLWSFAPCTRLQAQLAPALALRPDSAPSSHRNRRRGGVPRYASPQRHGALIGTVAGILGGMALAAADHPVLDESNCFGNTAWMTLCWGGYAAQWVLPDHPMVYANGLLLGTAGGVVGWLVGYLLDADADPVQLDDGMSITAVPAADGAVRVNVSPHAMSGPRLWALVALVSFLAPSAVLAQTTLAPGALDSVLRPGARVRLPDPAGGLGRYWVGRIEGVSRDSLLLRSADEPLIPRGFARSDFDEMEGWVGRLANPGARPTPGSPFRPLWTPPGTTRGADRSGRAGR